MRAKAKDISDRKREATRLTASAIDLTLARSAATARQFGLEIGRQRVDRFLKARRRRKRADKRVIGGIEGRRKSVG